MCWTILTWTRLLCDLYGVCFNAIRWININHQEPYHEGQFVKSFIKRSIKKECGRNKKRDYAVYHDSSQNGLTFYVTRTFLSLDDCRIIFSVAWLFGKIGVNDNKSVAAGLRALHHCHHCRLAFLVSGDECGASTSTRSVAAWLIKLPCKEGISWRNNQDNNQRRFASVNAPVFGGTSPSVLPLRRAGPEQRLSCRELDSDWFNGAMLAMRFTSIWLINNRFFSFDVAEPQWRYRPNW